METRHGTSLLLRNFRRHKAQIAQAGERHDEGIADADTRHSAREQRDDGRAHDGRGHQTRDLVRHLRLVIHTDGEDQRENIGETDADEDEAQPRGEGVIGQEQQQVADNRDGHRDAEEFLRAHLLQDDTAEETAHKQGDNQHDVAHGRGHARVLAQNRGDAVEHGSLRAAVEEDGQEHHHDERVSQSTDTVAHRGRLLVRLADVAWHEHDNHDQRDEQHHREYREEDAEAHVDGLAALRGEREPAVLHQRGADEYENQRRGERADGLQRLREGEHAGVLTLVRDIADQRVAGDLQNRGTRAHQQHRQQDDREVEGEDGQHRAGEEEEQADGEHLLLADLGLPHACGHRQNAEHDHARKGDQRRGEGRDVEGLLHHGDQLPGGVAETHGQKDKKQGNQG